MGGGQHGSGHWRTPYSGRWVAERALDDVGGGGQHGRVAAAARLSSGALGTFWGRVAQGQRTSMLAQNFPGKPLFDCQTLNCHKPPHQIVDLPAMLRFTGDASGDVCAHARSCFIQLVSKVTLQVSEGGSPVCFPPPRSPDALSTPLFNPQTFMDTFNDIARLAHSNDDQFYTQVREAPGIVLTPLDRVSAMCTAVHPPNPMHGSTPTTPPNTLYCSNPPAVWCRPSCSVASRSTAWR